MLPEISRQGCHRCEIGDRHRDRPPGIGAPAKVTVGGGREKESVKELASPATSAPSGRRPRVAPSRSVKAGTPGADAVGGPPERAVGSRADGGGLPAKGQGKPATGGASGAGAVDRCARALRCKFRPDPLGLAPPPSANCQICTQSGICSNSSSTCIGGRRLRYLDGPRWATAACFTIRSCN